jgi:hypothetical protein
MILITMFGLLFALVSARTGAFILAPNVQTRHLVDGRGLETVSLDGSKVHFDLNTDFFSERIGGLTPSAASSRLIRTPMVPWMMRARCLAASPARALPIWPLMM